MKYATLVWAGLWRKPARTYLTMFSIATAFALYGTLHGVTAGFDSVINAISATRLRVMNSNNSVESLPLAYKTEIESLANVNKVAYYQTMVAYYKDRKNRISVRAVGLEDYLDVHPEFALPPEDIEIMAKMRTGAIVGEELAKHWGWKIGDRVPITSSVFAQRDGSYAWSFDVVATYRIAKGHENLHANEVWVNFDYFEEERVGGKGLVMFYFVGVNDPNHAASVADSVDALFANSPFPTETMNERDYARAEQSQIGNISFFVKAIIGAVFFTLLFVTGNTMSQAVRDRIPELAVLKAYGFSDGRLMALVLVEGLFLSVFSASVGITIASTFFSRIFGALGVGAVPLPIYVFVIGIGFAAALGLMSTLASAWRVRRLRIVDALARR